MKQCDFSFHDYYHKLNSLWREFDILTLLPACTYAAHEGVLKHNQLIRRMQFLMGLNDVYKPIKSNILSRDPFSGFKYAFNIVSREESHKGLHHGSVSDSKVQPVVFVAKSNNFKPNDFKRNNTNGNRGPNNGNRGLNPNLLCINCGLIGHTIERCYEIFCYPIGFKRNPNLVKQGDNGGNITFNANSKVHKHASTSIGSTSFDTSFTKDQMMKNLSFINEIPTRSTSANMASNQHLTMSTQNMFNGIDISSLNLTIGHLNGTLSKIRAVGNLRLTDNVALFDVLVVPEYCVSLLYVHKLIKDSKLFVGFDEHKYYIQDLNMVKSVRTGNESGGLYLFDVKQYGLWGPYKVVSEDGYKYILTVVDDYSRAVWVFLIKTKDEVSFHIESFVELLITQFNKNVKVFRGRFLLICGLDEENIPSKGIQSEILGCGSSLRFQNTNRGDKPQTAIRRSFRVSKLPFKLNDFVFNSSVRYGLEKYIEAMNSEMEALYRNNIWILVDLPTNRKTIGCNWIYKVKYKSTGEIERYKASLVVHNGWSLFQLDVNNSFLYGDLNEDVYMDLPPGYYDENETMVCKLVKSLYGLKQALSLLACKPAATPMHQNKSLSHVENVDWAKCLVSRKYVSGFCVFYCGNLVSWKSKKQATIFKSSIEVEYRFLASTTCEVIWLVNLLKDLKMDGLLPVSLYCDSNSAIQIVVNHLFHEKTKHFEIDVYLVRKKVVSGVIKNLKVNSAEQVADIFTKGLSIAQHKLFYAKMDMIDIFAA
ncbi:ribonuclease H-like domain-containing protein [Tanacetum coccineum]|uniref:Ribonuclease H-like domain-containing protein n=1 Tax=Tanacetum coccineum TaxID=301880 RepID=A0ABQ4Y425_9ASTR